MFSDPKKNIRALGIHEGMRVADFGAGSGFYVKIASERVGSNGRVYAVEVQKDMIKKLESELKELGITNVDCIWGDIEREGGTKIKDESVDRVIVSNVLFQASDKLSLVDEVKRILKRDGKVLVVDWKESFGGMGPSPHHVVTSETARGLFEKRGFKFVENVSVEDHHYGIIFLHE